MKRIYKKDNNRMLRARVNEETYTKLEKLAQQLDVSLSALIRQFVMRGIREYYDTSTRFK